MRAGLRGLRKARGQLRPEPELRWGYAANVPAGGVGFLAVEPVTLGSDLELHVVDGPRPASAWCG